MKTKNNKKPAGKLHLIERGNGKVLDRSGLEETAFRRVPDEKLSGAMFQELYIKPLTDEGMEVEAALDLLLDGALMPN